jgi:hypothetical protein
MVDSREENESKNLNFIAIQGDTSRDGCEVRNELGPNPQRAAEDVCYDTGNNKFHILFTVMLKVGWTNKSVGV